jgi:hypothetical protein
MGESWTNTIRTLREGMVAPFWMNVLASSHLDLGSGVADRPRITPDGVAERLARRPRWLTPFTVAGFRPEEFQFLPAEELKRLTDGVGGVQTVASELRPDQTATDEQRGRALPHFQAVVEVLEFDRYGDAPALILGKQIEQRLVPVWPPHLDHLRFRTGLDSTDDPALWVWAFVAEAGEFDDGRFLERADVIEDVLEPVARKMAPEGRLYLRFRSTLDLPEAQGVPA